jgi:hypothetical protein
MSNPPQQPYRAQGPQPHRPDEMPTQEMPPQQMPTQQMPPYQMPPQQMPPYQGQPQGGAPVPIDQPAKGKRFGWLALALAAAIGLTLGGAAVAAQGGDGANTAVPAATVTATATATKTVTEPAPTETVTEKASEQPADEPTDSDITAGIYVVGEDIQPGTYKARAAEGDSCYWSRLDKDNEIIDNSDSEGRSVVTIKKSDYAFETSGCTPWIKQ